MRRAERSSSGRSAGLEAAARAGQSPKKKVDSKAAWREFRELLWLHRRRLTIGLTLMMISRLSGIVIPRWAGRDLVRVEMGRPILAPAKIPTRLGSGDGPVLEGIVIEGVILVTLANFLVDAIQKRLDPRV